LREYSGLSRQEFGNLFCSKESTVYEWEAGNNLPRLFKLINIAAYFGISLDCLFNGKVTGSNMMEARLIHLEGAEAFDAANDAGVGKLVARFHSLPDRYKERLLGYLDSLCREI